MSISSLDRDKLGLCFETFSESSNVWEGVVFRLMYGNPSSGIRENFPCGMRNTAQGIRIPLMIRIRNPTVPLTKPGIHYLESGTENQGAK